MQKPVNRVKAAELPFFGTVLFTIATGVGLWISLIYLIWNLIFA